MDSEFLEEAPFFFPLSFFAEDTVLVVYIVLDTEGKVSFVPFSVRKRRRADRPAAGGAGERESLLVLLLTVVLVLVLVFVFVLLLLFLVLVVVVVMVLTVFGGRRLLRKHCEWRCWNWMQNTHLQR